MLTNINKWKVFPTKWLPHNSNTSICVIPQFHWLYYSYVPYSRIINIGLGWMQSQTGIAESLRVFRVGFWWKPQSHKMLFIVEICVCCRKTSKHRRKKILNLYEVTSITSCACNVNGARCDWSTAAVLARDVTARALYVPRVRRALTESVIINLQHEALFSARVCPVRSRVSDEPGVGRVLMRDVSSTGRVLQLRHR